MIRCSSIMMALLLATATAAWAQSDMEAMLKMAQPGPAHEILKQFEGSWKQYVSANMGTGPSTGTGALTNRMILGGRFLQMDGAATVGGMTITSMSILGYDNRIGKYTLYSIDEFGTYAITARGAYDSTTRILTFLGVEEEGGMKMEFKITIAIVNKDTYTFRLDFTMPDGKDMTAVEIKCTRIVDK